MEFFAGDRVIKILKAKDHAKNLRQALTVLSKHGIEPNLEEICHWNQDQKVLRIHYVLKRYRGQSRRKFRLY